MPLSPHAFRVKVRCYFNHIATSGLHSCNKRRRASMAHFSICPSPNGTYADHAYTAFQTVASTRGGSLHRASDPCRDASSPVTLGQVLGFPQLGREVGGQVLMAQEHQPPPPELYVRLVTAYSSHGISYVFLIRMGCMPGQRDVFHRSHLDESSDGIGYRQEFVFGSTVGGWR
jgi:hypothetical protein